MNTSSASKKLSVLMSAYLDGDPNAFAALHHRVSPHVRSRLRSLGLPPDLVDDLEQEAFLRAHASRKSFDLKTTANQAVLAWFGSIARNAAVDYFRSDTRRLRRYARAADRGITLMGESETFAASPEHMQLGVEARRQTQQRVRSAVKELAPIYREVIELHKFEGLSVRQIAEQKGLRRVTVRVRAHRGYKSLARQLQPG